ncbi:LOW QUALITY PROTEIN: E3 ubiquitin-protein ligase listerin [Aplochiton taeniatus]
MGGKNKQRTKGNVRPSSSGRAAELLSRESGVVPGFIGFGSSATTEQGYVPAVHGAEEIDNMVDADFRLVLRKLSKRDAVTKLKAVQEFGSMCKDRDADVVKGVLPYWPRIYCRISLDHDRRVREASQQAFEQLVLKVGRSLAPFLKSLMGHWLLAQCDTYPPAASAASQAFSAAFPPSKQGEAMGFCRDEVLTVLQDNLLKETADTLSDPQSVPDEEREAKFLRLVTSSLLGVKRLLSSLPESDRLALEDLLRPLVSQAKFWKYSKHKTPQVRGAFFEAVSALCEHAPGLVQAEAPRVCPTVLLSIDDTDPIVLPALWDAVLHVLSTVTDCWTHVNARKGFFPKLWSLLVEGGKGMATALHPNLLPLVSKLPSEVTHPALAFYTTFLTSLIQGVSSERASSSPTESGAVVRAVVECVRYTLLQNTADEDQQRGMRHMLISDQGSCNPALQSGPLFPLVADMLVSWEKRAGLQGVGGSCDEKEVFHRLLADFWEELSVVLVRHVDKEEAEPKVLEGVATLLQVMRNPDTAERKRTKKKKSVKICFSDVEDQEEAEGEKKRAQAEVPDLGQDRDVAPLSSMHLEDVVCQLAQLNLVYIKESGSERHLIFLSLLLRSFHTPRVFTMLMDDVDDVLKAGEGEGEREDRALAVNPAVRFVLHRVLEWLRQDGRADTAFLVEMLFSSLHCCSRQETTRILDHVSTMERQWSILLQIIQKACADQDTLLACRDWLKGPVLGGRLLGLVEELCEAGLDRARSASLGHAHSWSLVTMVLSYNNNNEPLIGEVYVERILEKLHSTLSQAKVLSDRGNMEPLVSFICDVAAAFFSCGQHCHLLAASEELLLTVLQLTAQEQTHTHLTLCWVMLRTGCVCPEVQSLGPGSLRKRRFKQGTFLHSAALWVKSQVLSAPLGITSLKVLVSANQSLVETIITACVGEAPPAEWTPAGAGRLPRRGGVESKAPPPKLPAHLSVCGLLAAVLHSAAVTPPDQQGAACSLTDLPLLRDTECLYAIQWGKEMSASSSVLTDYQLFLSNRGLPEDIYSLVTPTDLLETLYCRSVEEGGLWSLTLEDYIHANNMAATNASALRKLYGSLNSGFPLSQSQLSTLQVLCPVMSAEERLELTHLATAGVLDWQEDHRVCGCLAVLLCCLKADTMMEQDVLLAVLETMMEWRNSKEDMFLFSSDLSKASAAQLSLGVEMMRFLRRLLTHSPRVLGGSQWDFLLCSALAWLETASENVGSLWNPWVQLFVCESAELIVSLNRFFASPPAGVADLLPPELTGEWTDFFVEGIYNLMLLPVKITEAFPEPDDPVFPLAALQCVGVALAFVPVEKLKENSLPPRFVADQRSSLPAALQTLLNTFSPLLLHNARPLQVTAYHLLEKVMPHLPECDGEGDSSKTDDDREDPSLSPPAALMTVLSASEDLCESILASVQVGEFAVVQPLSHESSCILGYLLAWKLLLSFFKASPSHLRVQYSQHLKKSGSLHKLLLHLFRLMPENPAYPAQGGEPVAKETRTFFTETLSLSVDKSVGVEWELPHVACSVYYSTVQDLPAMVRLWWTSQEKRVSTAVDQFTSKHVSPALCAQEISSVHTSTQTFHSMTVKARSAAREVVATYSVDDIYIELVIQLAPDHPLGALSVECGRRVGVAVQQWRNWMLQLSTFLTHQNGSIMEGLALWKNNVDKRFEGVEDCMICFSVIHGTNYSLPKKACRTCKKKFHSACLYKWFTTSNKSTCPMCRETFF